MFLSDLDSAAWQLSNNLTIRKMNLLKACEDIALCFPDLTSGEVIEACEDQYSEAAQIISNWRKLLGA
jgi:hypothetical protein